MESDRSIFLQYDGGAKERQGFAFVDKATRESRAINRFIFEDGFVYRPEYLYPLSDGWCAMLLYPEDIFKNTVFAQRFPGLDEESNIEMNLIPTRRKSLSIPYWFQSERENIIMNYGRRVREIEPGA